MQRRKKYGSLSDVGVHMNVDLFNKRRHAFIFPFFQYGRWRRSSHIRKGKNPGKTGRRQKDLLYRRIMKSRPFFGAAYVTGSTVVNSKSSPRTLRKLLFEKYMIRGKMMSVFIARRSRSSLHPIDAIMILFSDKKINVSPVISFICIFLLYFSVLL